MDNLDPNVLANAKNWLTSGFDEETRQQVQDMIDNNPKELEESFYRHLEFGTGGLRGIMGVGTNRMNKYMVGMATQGLANYLKENFVGQEIKVAIAHDSRNNSRYFTEITADVFSANGFKVYVFDSLRPTPELSYAIRHYKCQSGVVITASHNPKEYNGYKAYWDDGAQLIPPHDKNVISEVQNIKDVTEVKFEGIKENIIELGEDFDKLYLAEIKAQSLSPELIKKHKDIKIVYTALHGTGTKMVPWCLQDFGFNNVYSVEEQSIPDGNFPTVHSPNPEEPAALEMAIEKAKEVDATLVMGTDPDSDRVGIAVKNINGDFELLNGNQTASLLLYYMLTKWQENGKIKGKEFIVKTIVTSELLVDIANDKGVETFDVLTGFKWIADIIKQLEGKKTFIGGGEESYGYMIGDFVRDKDAVASCAMIAETAAWAAEQGKTMYELLIDIYLKYGFYKEKLISVVRKGKSGAEEIAAMMENLRNNPPSELAGSPVTTMKDYQAALSRDFTSGTDTPIDLPKSNVLQFFAEDGSKISARPSGTEPKIKFYFGVKDNLDSIENFEAQNQKLEDKVQTIIKELNL